MCVCVRACLPFDMGNSDSKGGANSQQVLQFQEDDDWKDDAPHIQAKLQAQASDMTGVGSIDARKKG